MARANFEAAYKYLSEQYPTIEKKLEGMLMKLNPPEGVTNEHIEMIKYPPKIQVTIESVGEREALDQYLIQIDGDVQPILDEFDLHRGSGDVIETVSKIFASMDYKPDYRRFGTGQKAQKPRATYTTPRPKLEGTVGEAYRNAVQKMQNWAEGAPDQSELMRDSEVTLQSILAIMVTEQGKLRIDPERKKGFHYLTESQISAIYQSVSRGFENSLRVRQQQRLDAKLSEDDILAIVNDAIADVTFQESWDRLSYFGRSFERYHGAVDAWGNFGGGERRKSRH